jgi:prefoldin subunit 5
MTKAKQQDIAALTEAVAKVVDEKAAESVIEFAESAIEKLQEEIYGNEAAIAKLEDQLAMYREQNKGMATQIKAHRQVIAIFGGA